MAALCPRDLARRGFHTLGKPAADKISENLSDVAGFESDNIIDQVGWVGSYFALPSGRVFGPRSAIEMKAVFQPAPTLSRRSGSLKRWRRLIADTITGQPLLTFIAGLPLAAALMKIVGLSDNLIVEVVDAAGSGGSVLHSIAGSVTGDIIAGAIPFGVARRNAPEHRFLHADGLMMIQDPRADLASLSLSRIQNEVMGLLRDGASTAGSHGTQGPVATLIVGRQSLVDLVGAETPAAQLLTEHVITLEVPSTQSFGVFEKVPNGFNTCSAAIAEITAAARQNHGIPLRRFIVACVERLAEDATGFRAGLEKSMASFRRNARIDMNNMAQVTLTDKFALVYAAIKLAQDIDVFPADWKGGHAVLVCYKNYLVSLKSDQPGVERIEEMASLPEVIFLSSKLKHSSNVIRNSSIFIRNRSGKRTLMVRRGFLDKFVGDENRFLARSDVRERLIRDGAHLTRPRGQRLTRV